MTKQLHNKPLLLHPTDFSFGSEVAFGHALSIALAKKSGLSVLHVGEANNNIPWDKFPGVRETLTNWGLLDSDAKRTEVYDRLGITVEKVETQTRSVVDGITEFGVIHKYGTDMLVLATEGRDGLPRWLKPSKAERVARNVRLPALFVPDSSSMVNLGDGSINLKSILIPIDHSPDPQYAINYIVNMLSDMNISGSEITLLHIGDDQHFPDIETPNYVDFSFEKQSRKGETVANIISTAQAQQSQLIVMATNGHDGFLDALRGSNSERVLRESLCPVLTLPV